MATLFGSYSLIGGLGTTFYVSYFNACLVFILLIVFVIKILHNEDDQWKNIGDTGRMFESISCIQGPEDNVNNSYITFRLVVQLLLLLLLLMLFIKECFPAQKLKVATCA
jgi:Na+/proline symporter